MDSGSAAGSPCGNTFCRACTSFCNDVPRPSRSTRCCIHGGMQLRIHAAPGSSIATPVESRHVGLRGKAGHAQQQEQRAGEEHAAHQRPIPSRTGGPASDNPAECAIRRTSKPSNATATQTTTKLKRIAAQVFAPAQLAIRQPGCGRRRHRTGKPPIPPATMLPATPRCRSGRASAPSNADMPTTSSNIQSSAVMACSSLQLFVHPIRGAEASRMRSDDARRCRAWPRPAPSAVGFGAGQHRPDPDPVSMPLSVCTGSTKALQAGGARRSRSLVASAALPNAPSCTAKPVLGGGRFRRGSAAGLVVVATVAGLVSAGFAAGLVAAGLAVGLDSGSGSGLDDCRRLRGERLRRRRRAARTGRWRGIRRQHDDLRADLVAHLRGTQARGFGVGPGGIRPDAHAVQRYGRCSVAAS